MDTVDDLMNEIADEPESQPERENFYHSGADGPEASTYVMTKGFPMAEEIGRQLNAADDSNQQLQADAEDEVDEPVEDHEPFDYVEDDEADDEEAIIEEERLNAEAEEKSKQNRIAEKRSRVDELLQETAMLNHPTPEITAELKNMKTEIEALKADGNETE